MASTEASRRASVASSSEMSFADSTTAAKILPKKDAKKDKPTGGFKLKKSLAKKTTKSKDAESNGTNTAGATRSPSPSSPSVSANTASKTEGGDRPGTSKCKNCSKPVENAHFEAHVKHCQEQKKADQKKAREAKKAKDAKAKAKETEEGKDKNGDGDSVTGDRPQANGVDKPDTNGDASSQATKKVPSKKSAPPATKMTDGPKKNKKRKGDELDGAEKEPKKKKVKKTAEGTGAANNAGTAASNGAAASNDPPKPKLPKPKGPVNVELQCGVALPNGGFCARSLTCKSHSMGSKRSVPGRSAPYDTLLQQYQKKNQAKQQKLALANQALEHNAEDAEGAEGAPVDSEEEREAVMRAVTRGWGGRPLEQYVQVGSRRRYGAVRRREGLLQALAGGKLFSTAAPNGYDGGSGARTASIAGSIGIGGASPDLNGPGEDAASRRASLAQTLSGKNTGAGGSGGGGGSRKPSLGGGGGSAGP